jgi:putative ABC transport system ATP-binding protein
MLRMTNLSKVYRTHMIETHALRGFEIDVKEGEFVTVTGPSGSGKTSFLNIAGLLEEFTGRIHPRRRQREGPGRQRPLAPAQREARLHLPGLQPDPRPEPVRQRRRPAALPRLQRQRAQERIEDALAKVGLASRMKHYPAELSGGQQQRVAIARALAGTPKLLLADEPTGNLDTQMARGVMELLEEINAAGTTILMVTHDPELAVRTQRNVHIIDGQVSDLVRKARRWSTPTPQPPTATLRSARMFATTSSWACAACAATRR